MNEYISECCVEEHRFCFLTPIYGQEPNTSNVRDGQCETWTGAKTGGKVPEPSQWNRSKLHRLGCFQGLGLLDILRHLKTYLRMLRLPFQSQYRHPIPARHLSEAHVKPGNREFHEVNILKKTLCSRLKIWLKFNFGVWDGVSGE